MTEPKPSPALRFFPSLTDVAFLMPILFIFLKLDGAKTLLGDGDTGWHIRTGDWILANGRVPDRDIFSFTKPGEPWFAWEWLWDVAFAWLHQHWGMAAVVLASILVICTTFALLYRLARRKCGNSLLAIAIVFLAVAGSSIHWLARPHLFTLLFLAIFYWILELDRERRRRVIWLLPALTVLWTNLHGGFFVGIALIAAYAAGDLLAAVLDPAPESRPATLAAFRRYSVVAGLCFAASFINPYFYNLHVHIGRYLTDSFQQQNIIEFQSVSFQNPAARYFELMLVLAALAAAWNVYRRRFAYSILLLGWVHLALYSARNIPLFSLLATPVVAETAVELLARLQSARVAAWLRRALAHAGELARETSANDRMGRWPLAAVAGFLVLIFLFSLPVKPSPLQAEYSPKDYPAKAVQMLRASEFSTGVFTDDEWGDYLIYRLYPAARVFVDGRSDFYGEEFSKKYIGVMNGKYDWKKTLEHYGIHTVLLPVNAPLAGTLKESREWRVVYDDGVAIVFRSVGPQTQLVRERPDHPQVSVVTNNGLSRDRAITNPEQGDPWIASSYARR